MSKIWKNYWAISEKNAELTDGQTGTRTDGQTDNDDFIGPSVARGSNKTSQFRKIQEKSVYKEVNVETTPRWLEISLKKARIDTKACEVHSLRTVPWSKTSMEELKVPVVLATGRWSRELILVKLYKKNIIVYSPVPSRYLMFLPIQFILYETYFMVF